MTKILENKGRVTGVKLTREKNDCYIMIIREKENTVRQIFNVDPQDIPSMISHLETIKMGLLQRWWTVGTVGEPPKPKLGKDVGVG